LNTGEIQDYFLYLVKERHLSPASCRLSLNGIRFLYQEVLQREFEAKIQIPKRSQRIPELLTRKEAPQSLGSVSTASTGCCSRSVTAVVCGSASC
jgi:site-specific recombinase XerD